MANKYTTEQMADLWEDVHEIENMMGRRAFHILLRQDKRTWEECWCRKAPDPCLGLENGYYRGYDALEAWFAANEQFTALKAKLARLKYPEELKDKTDAELFGVGSLNVNSLSTPVIEVAEDRETAKGLWYCMDHVVDYTPTGRRGALCWGRLGVDFVREDGQWKIWHMVFVPDFNARPGTDWAKPQPEEEPDPVFAPLADFEMPACNGGEGVPAYDETRPILALPQVPRPYRTFSETFSYGI